MSRGSPLDGYDLVVCQQCGFGFSDNIPSQKEMDAYYKDMSKYENKHQAGKVSGAALANYQAIVSSLNPFLPGKEIRIADIGCATGALLSVFQSHGYANVAGIDPSPSCAETAAQLYGISVMTSSLFDVPAPETPFDLVVFSSVLEHVVDLRGALPQVSRLLAPGGLVFIEVPDTVNFAAWISAPFQQFSVEHVNYFSPTSLSNLMRAFDFVPIALWHDIRTLGGIKDPALSTLYRKAGGGDRTLVRDHETEVALTHYIQRSRENDAALQQRIAALVSSQRPIVIWGAGTQAQRLLATTALAKANIRAFVDSNSNYHGQQLHGVRIISPDDLKNHPEAILIASQVFQEEIASAIRTRLRLENEVIKIFDSPAL
jgi:SAM-dependent methyltransferase